MKFVGFALGLLAGAMFASLYAYQFYQNRMIEQMWEYKAKCPDKSMTYKGVDKRRLYYYISDRR